MVVSSGSPFNITAPNDINGDSIFNDRPGLVSSATCAHTTNTPPSTIYCTPIGTFDAAGASSGVPLLPINYGTGPSHVTLNLRRYNLTFGMNVRNVFNKVNLSNPSGILGSPFFGVPNGLQGGPFSTGTAVRKLELQATFAF